MGLRLVIGFVSLLLFGALWPTLAFAESSGGSGGSTGTRSDYPCSGCITVTPPGYAAGTPVPLLVTFHGDEGEPRYIHGELEGHAEDAGFLIVSLRCPRDLGCSGSWWRWEANSRSHDFAWLGEQVDQVEADYDVERNQVYLAGFSGGSSYLSEVMPRFSDRFAGAIYFGGGYEPYGVECPSCQVPVHFIIGDSDFLLDGAMDLRGWYESCGHEVDWQLVPGTDHTIVGSRLPPVLASMSGRVHPCRAPAPPPPPPPPPPVDAGGSDAGVAPIGPPADGGTGPGPGPFGDAGPGADPSAPRELSIVGECSIGVGSRPAPIGALAWLIGAFLLRRRRRTRAPHGRARAGARAPPGGLAEGAWTRVGTRAAKAGDQLQQEGRTMNKLLAAGLAGTLLALGAGVAHAGTARRSEVRIFLTEASGVPRHAREIRDPYQYIGCAVQQVGSQGATTSCFARDRTGRSLACRNALSAIGTAGQAETISAMGPDTLINFQSSVGRCISVSARNDSVYLDGPVSMVLPAERAAY